MLLFLSLVCRLTRGHQAQNDGPYHLGKKKLHDSEWSFVPPSVNESQGLVCGRLCTGHHRMQRELRPSSSLTLLLARKNIHTCMKNEVAGQEEVPVLGSIKFTENLSSLLKGGVR